MTIIPKDARIFVGGHARPVGTPATPGLEAEGFTNLLVAGPDQLDCRRPVS